MTGGPDEPLVLFDDLAPRSVHCATLAETGPGRLFAACYAFSFETSPDSTIEAAVFEDGAWSASRTIVDLPGLAVGNPVLHRDPQGPLHLFFVAVYGEGWTDARVLQCRSHDGGDSWSTPRLVHERTGLMTKTHPLVTEEATLLPVYDERTWCPHVLVAPDLDGPWQLHGDTTARGKAIQPALAPTREGKVLMLSRSRLGAIHVSQSFDGGRSWTASQATDLPNPDSGIDLIALRNAGLLLVHNPDARGRSRLRVSVSRDDGETWRPVRTLADGAGEFSYPYALQGRDGEVHVLYTRHRTHIAHARLRPSETDVS